MTDMPKGEPEANGAARPLIAITPEVMARLRDPRVTVGWLLIAVGAVAVFLGYWGVSSSLDTGKQLPYLVSGGIGGVFLLGLGTSLLFSSDLADARGQIRELRGMIEELESRLVGVVADDALVVEADAAATASSRRSTSSAGGVSGSNGHRVVALPSGSTFHEPGCGVLAGKEGAQKVDARQISDRRLTPCRLCEPALRD